MADCRNGQGEPDALQPPLVALMSGLFCGIDVGSTNIKVLLMNDAGQTLWVKSAPSPRIHDGIGVVTDGMQLVSNLEQLIEQGWREVGGGKPLAAISATGIGEDGFCVDTNVKPVAHAIPWFDKRDNLEAEQLAQADAAKLHPQINFAFATSAAKWLWLSRHRPEELPRDAVWITLADFPLAYWAQQPFISSTLLPRTGIYDVFARAIILDLAHACAAPRLPIAKDAGQIVGTVLSRGLIASGAADQNTLCVSGGHDHPIASSAILRVNPLARIDSIGTANAMFAETTQPLPGASTAGIDLSLPVRGGPGIAVLGPIEFSVPLFAAYGSEAAIRDLLKVERISGPPAPTPPNLRSAVFNKSIRPLLEALSWQALVFLKRMDVAGVGDGPIYATGGWARSRALMELRASIYGESITAIHEPELTALGAALFAAQAVNGPNPDFMRYRDIDTFEPVAEWMATYAAWA